MSLGTKTLFLYSTAHSARLPRPCNVATVTVHPLTPSQLRGACANASQLSNYRGISSALMGVLPVPIPFYDLKARKYKGKAQPHICLLHPGLISGNIRWITARDYVGGCRGENPQNCSLSQRKAQLRLPF